MVHLAKNQHSAADYCRAVLRNCHGPWLRRQSDAHTLILMEDGAPVHKSNLAMKWRQRCGLVKMVWPANSPDLNPIKNVWKWLKDGIQKNYQPLREDEMKPAITAQWEEIPAHKLELLVASMPDRMKAVVKAKGASTRW